MKKKYIITAFAITTLPAMLTARPYGNCPLGGHFFGGGMFMWITALLLIIALAFFIFHTAKNKQTGGDLFSSNNSTEEPLQILKKRLAKGEITENEYESLKEKLSE